MLERESTVMIFPLKKISSGTITVCCGADNPPIAAQNPNTKMNGVRMVKNGTAGTSNALRFSNGQRTDQIQKQKPAKTGIHERKNGATEGISARKPGRDRNGNQQRHHRRSQTRSRPGKSVRRRSLEETQSSVTDIRHQVPKSGSGPVGR